jgi:CheY-like chemotaxis protein
MTMSHTLNLVIVDDDQDDHDLMKDSLWRNEIPFHILSFYNGQQLVDFLEMLNSAEGSGDYLPDLIILDINMPVMNGVEALKAIQKIPRANRVPVYLVSTCRDPDISDTVLNLSRGFYTKPYTQAEYKTFIEAIFLPHVVSEEKKVG